ncbi:hypothetical protein [Collimonas antrihumi]|uniref:hypothetical protein n=1 Tax=Collimonas antrihumi TaxID=1940615 RepID=UPI001B8BBD78|nr:hypothetical protein [Collimonas antrihumi]
MSYLEVIAKALKGRSINQASKDWGMQQVTLHRYVKGGRIPDALTAKIIAHEAGISGSEMLDLMAEEEQKRRAKTDKMSTSFNWLLRVANVGWMRVPATA